MYCEHCGARLEKDQKFCNQCGEITVYEKKLDEGDVDLLYEIVPAEEKKASFNTPGKESEIFPKNEIFQKMEAEVEFSAEESPKKDPFVERERYPSQRIYKEDYAVGMRAFLIMAIALFFPMILLFVMGLAGSIMFDALPPGIIDGIRDLLNGL